MSSIELFDLRRVVQFRISLEADSLEFRLEILQSRTKPARYRAALSRLESYRVQSTFPQQDGRPSDHPSDERVWVDWSAILRTNREGFAAPSAAAAERIAMHEIKAWVNHTRGTCWSEPHSWAECRGPLMKQPSQIRRRKPR